MLKWIIRFFKALNANSHPGEIAHAFAYGMILGFLPKSSLLWYVLFFGFFVIRMNKGAFLLTILLGSLIAPLCDSLFDSIGYAVLTNEALTGMFKSWLDIPFVAFTRFNNTIVCGALVFSVIAYIPFYLFMRLFVKVWRKTLQPMLVNNPISKAFMKLPLVKMIFSTAQKLEMK